MYKNAKKLKALSVTWNWYCLAAPQRHSDAQYAFGNFYRWGRGPITQDLVHAHLWYTLSVDQGHTAAGKGRQLSSEEMTAAEIIEAERLIAEREPNPAECETIGAQAEN